MHTWIRPRHYLLAFMVGCIVGMVAQVALAQQVLVQPFGNGYSVGAPGQPPVLVQPFGNGYTVAQPGQAPTLIQPFGQNSWIVTPPPGGQAPVIAPIDPSFSPY